MQTMAHSAKHIAVLFLTFLIGQAFCYAYGDSTGIRKNILKIARKIAKYETIDRGPVGFSAELTKQFDRFIYLMNNATEDELVMLTDHKNPKVRAYSFEILVAKGYKNIRQIINNHINDISLIKIREGCMSRTEHINLYFLHFVTPRNNDKNPNIKFTDAEVKELEAKMTKAIGTKL